MFYETFMKPCETLTKAYSGQCDRALFSHIQAYNFLQHLHMQKPDIIRVLEHSEAFRSYIPTHIQNSLIFPLLHPDAYSELSHIYENLRIFRTRTYWKRDAYSEPFQKFRMEFFAKIIKNDNYISKALYLSSLTGFWTRLDKYYLNKYSLTCTVTSSYILLDIYSKPCLWL